ncbi:MAG: tRNA (adenosine(37)-N6)-threonylcarbamoyltransferase complex transferase subunit TsaD [Planctomycetes bacterium]|jgi:N6-L-threonylcarbamoyladenine synthase|nr:tRNA (adenosine(37)-N6)-threonylcarbamoyltransferase complex transferase subunit TsaD [Planctomycetota bacterium]
MTSETQFILGIESSCDETAAAIVADGKQVVSSVVHSQIDEHAAWGGVVPEIAGRSHLRSIRTVVDQCLTEANMHPEQLSGIAVTNRPGLMGSLLIGVTAAKALAYAWQKPIVGVHHIEAHIYAALMSIEQPTFPFITLVVSGGHTSLYRSDSALEHQLLGATRDDAAGECLDKAAAMLELSYPGGPSIQKAGAHGDPKSFQFKQPMLNRESLDFSFSGMKTALLYKLRGPGNRLTDPWIVDRKHTADVCASFEHAVVSTLARKCVRACQQHDIQQVLVGGGVACNLRLRRIMDELCAEHNIQATFAPPAYCTDNAVMIAGLGYELFAADKADSLNLDVFAQA